jgi:hypothetical protein
MYRFFLRLFCGRSRDSESLNQKFDRVNEIAMRETAIQEAADKLAVLSHAKRSRHRLGTGDPS